MAENPHAIIPTNTMSTSSIPSITIAVKLTSTNYLLWKTQLQPILCVYDLMEHVDGSSSTPLVVLDVAPNPTYQSWMKRDQLVLSWIISAISESLLPQIVGSETACDA